MALVRPLVQRRPRRSRRRSVSIYAHDPIRSTGVGPGDGDECIKRRIVPPLSTVWR